MKRLKAEYQELADDFEANYEGVGCCCHQNPPCGYCTHEGHPENLAETPEAWVEMLEPMCEGQEQILLGDDTPALKQGNRYWVKNSTANCSKLSRQYDGVPSAEEFKLAGGSLLSVLLVDIERVFGGVV